MPPLLPSRSWRISYSSKENNPIADFYIPALECAIQYDRKSGFFNSAILSKVARGLGAMLEQEGKMRLIMGCRFSPQDLQAIEQGYELKEALTICLARDLQPPTNFSQLKHWEILSWLIAHSFLDIKIAIPLKDNGLPLELDHHHLFHEKTGIFTDAQGNQLAFSGSNNESLGGWEDNVESFHAYCSWDGGKDLERVLEEQYRFDELWNDLALNVRVFDIPEAVRQQLLHYAPATKPSWSKQVEYDHSPLEEATAPLPPPVTSREPAQDLEQELEHFQILLHLPQHPGCFDYCLKSIPITPWAHQLKIVRRIAQQFPRSALIADEVGLGKTISTGLLLRYLLVSRKVKRVLILVPASVQSQWQGELREKFNLHCWSYSQGQFMNSYGEISSPQGNPWNSKDLILASSHLVRRKERQLELLEANPWDLIILDEAHHARRRSPQERSDSPNCLLTLIRQLREKTKAMLLLTATPMQIDNIEVFDLLNLVGLKGQWQYQDNFCDYFDSLAAEPEPLQLQFWQQMSVDYFSNGASPCARLEQYLSRTDRLLFYRLQDTWQKGKQILNGRQLCSDTPFINASRQYLTANTPLKDLMFRHTRDTLREYYRRGILTQNIPRREVFDNTIRLEPKREAPLYKAVSDYVRHFYNLAQQENRKGLGFLMTLYRRRLTSSFYAIQKSLERRLQGISITEDDLIDLDDAEDEVISGLESYFTATDPQEIEYLENLLQQFQQTGEDSKLSHFLTILRRELQQRETVLVFDQYTDTMDYLREALIQLYGSQVACYSGRGGELYQAGQWRRVKKDEIKQRFREGRVKILLCTKSASEGLNLQTCGVMFQYSMPWNPMQVEQQIGRLDRIGQIHPTVRIHNFYYDGTVEAKVYSKLRERINAFETVVGSLQPILAQVPTYIEQAAMAADPEEEGVLMREFEQKVLNTPPLRPALEEMVAMDVEADLQEIRQQWASTPVKPEEVEKWCTQSRILGKKGIEFVERGDRIWQMRVGERSYEVTFYPEVYEESNHLRLMGYGEPLFELLLEIVLRVKEIKV